MIKEDKFSRINTDVIESLNEVFDKIKTENTSNYVLLLANGDYIPDLEKMPNYSPYVIDYMLDVYRDMGRFEFLVEFMQKYYTFKNTIVYDDKYRINLELMIYTHIWESKPFLKKLYRISQLSNKKEYKWKVTVPDMKKYDFIRKEIRGVFEVSNLKIAEILKKGFHTSLRNAFAHSEYSFNTMNDNNHIELHNYKGKYWELQRINFDEWSERFAYSVLLCYNLEDIIAKRRKSVVQDLKTNAFIIKHPMKDGKLKDVRILFDDSRNQFSFER